jgi:hypothetical protein
MVPDIKRLFRHSLNIFFLLLHEDFFQTNLDLETKVGRFTVTEDEVRHKRSFLLVPFFNHDNLASTNTFTIHISYLYTSEDVLQQLFVRSFTQQS